MDAAHDIVQLIRYDFQLMQLANMIKSIHSRIITGELIACVAIRHEPSLCVNGS